MTNHRKLVFGIALVVVAAIVVLSFYYLKVILPSTPEASIRSTASPYIPTISDVRNALLEKSKIVFPEVAARKRLAINDLPADLKNLIDSPASSQNQLTYADGRLGFEIQYPIDRSLINSYRYFGSATVDWPTLFSARGYTAAMVEKQAPDYLIRITQTVLDQNHSDVLIQTINHP